MTEADAEEQGEFIERLDDDGRQSDLNAIAPHGGDIEPQTDQQAELVASLLASQAVSAWRCKGWNGGQGAFDRWHITSTDICEASFPLLNSVMISRRFAHAVAFHGFKERGILIGGTAPDTLKLEISEAVTRATACSDIEVRIAGPDDKFGGDDPANIVNRLTTDRAGGIQIEQSLRARSRHWPAIADAIACVYRKL